MKGSYLVSEVPIPQPESASAPGPSRLEEVHKTAPTQSCSVPVSGVGRKVHLPKAQESLVTILSNCVHTGRVPTTEEILTLMDSADPQPDSLYIDCLSDFLEFGIYDALDIHNTEFFFLASFGDIGRGNARNLRKYTRDKILVPLDLVSTKSEPIEKEDVVDTKSESIAEEEVMDMTDSTQAINRWRFEVEPEYVEEIKDDKGQVAAVVEEIEEVEEVGEESTVVGEEEVEVEGDTWVDTWFDDTSEV